MIADVTTNTAMGVDVSEKHGLDIVVMEGLVVRETLQAQTLEEFANALRQFDPDVVAIDSPPAWGKSGKSRLAERQLARWGVSTYSTPSDPAVFHKTFYAWMRDFGFKAYTIAEAAGYERYRSGDVFKTAIEIYPYSTFVALADYLPPGDPSDGEKIEWRSGLLAAQGVDIQRLTTIDLVDAALAALTGILALEGQRVGVGDPTEGVIVLPMSVLPTARWVRHLRPAA